jgi:hypothetical protein
MPPPSIGTANRNDSDLKERSVNIVLDVPGMFSYHPPTTKPASAGSPAREDTMSVSKFLTEFLGFAGLLTSLYGWTTLVGHLLGS